MSRAICFTTLAFLLSSNLALAATNDEKMCTDRSGACHDDCAALSNSILAKGSYCASGSLTKTPEDRGEYRQAAGAVKPPSDVGSALI